MGRAEEGAIKSKTPRIIFAPPAHGLLCPRPSPPGVCSRAVEGAKLDKIGLPSVADIRIGPNFLLERTLPYVRRPPFVTSKVPKVETSALSRGSLRA